MNFEIKTQGFTMDEAEKEFVGKKTERFKKAEDYLQDLIFTFYKDGALFKSEATLHFKWGVHGQVEETSHDFKTSCDKLVDKLQLKITKEKEKHAER